MHAAGHTQGTSTGAKQQQPPGAANPGSAHNTNQTTAREKVPSNTQPGGGAPRDAPPAGPMERGACKGTRTVGSADRYARTPHPESEGSGPRPHAGRTGSQGSGSAPAWTPLTKAGAPRPPPGAPSCHLHSVQCQLARACSVWSVTGPHGRASRAQRTRPAKRYCLPKRTGSRGRESA